MSKHNVGQVQVQNLQTGATMFLSFGTWAQHRKLEKQSGKKLYKLIKTTPSTGSNTTVQSTEQPQVQVQSRSLGSTTPPPPPKKKKKSCNC